MTNIFLKVFNLSINASYLIFAIVVLRFLLKKAPKTIFCVLWGLVAFRLICPFSFESILSLLPSGETIPQNFVYSDNPQIYSGIYALNSVVNPIISNSLSPTHMYSANPAQIFIFIISLIWLMGIGIMLIYTVISYLRITFKVRESIKPDRNIYVCDRIDTPFILGVIKPRIYLPSIMSEQDMEYVLAHEKAHIKRLDHLWKPIGFILLTVYWFNPIIWLSYILLCRDIELACDQKVIKEMGADYKKPYSNALINCSVPRKMISACPLAFGEVGVKGRIKSVLSYKKPTFWIIIVSVILSIAVAVCFLTVPKGMHLYDINDGWVNTTLLDNITEVGLVDSSINRDDMITVNFKGIVDELYNVKISRKPISNDRNDYRERSKIIILRKNDSYCLLCFSEGFNSVFIDNGVKPTLSYKVLNPEKLQNIFKNFSDSNNITGASEDNFILGSRQYKGEKIIYENGSFSSIIYTDDNIPIFGVSDDKLHLYTSDWPMITVHSSMYDIGELKKVNLKKQKFDDMLSSEMWKNGFSAKRLLQNNLNAFYVNDYAHNNMYYLLQQKNGDIYIAQGYIDTNTIRYIFKMIENKDLSNDSVETFIFTDSPDLFNPKLSLDYSNNSFNFSYSGFSSYFPRGSFVITDDTLICKTDDGLNTYQFMKSDNGYIFDEDNSSTIPKYKYSADAKTSLSPVPDNALFKRKTTNPGVNPYFNATVLEVNQNSLTVKPFADEEELKTSDKIIISTDVISTNPVPKVEKGTQIRVVYNGNIEETYPAKISGVFAIYLLEDIE